MQTRLVFLGLTWCLLWLWASDCEAKNTRLSTLAEELHRNSKKNNIDALLDPHPYTYELKWFTQILDHFNFQTEKKTFRQRYLVNTDHWKFQGGKSGPIFFYCGNEGDIHMFADNTGFQWEAAKELGAMVVFAEHRYYGKSLPFGDESFDPKHIGWLTSEQALADFAYMLVKLKEQWGAQTAPVIAWGGSYGAMLAAWFRVKYPHIIAGALASSGPVLYFEGLVDSNSFNKIASLDFKKVDPECPQIIHKGLLQIEELTKTRKGREKLDSQFKTCQPLVDQPSASKLLDWAINGYTYMAMVNYPYPTSFLTPMPGWPVRESCRKAIQEKADSLYAIVESVGVYYNSSGQLKCVNVNDDATPDLGTNLWDYQTCTEMMMPMSSDGADDMFPAKPWNRDEYFDHCMKKWKTQPIGDWATIEYGSVDLKAASNIIFSNGELDPWMGGGITTNISSTVLGFVIKDAAHHLDLRSSHKDDPEAVKEARSLELREIKRWIQEWYASH